MSGAEADAYAKAVVSSRISMSRATRMFFRKLVKDLADKKVALPDQDIRRAMNELMAEAIAQITKSG